MRFRLPFAGRKAERVLSLQESDELELFFLYVENPSNEDHDVLVRHRKISAGKLAKKRNQFMDSDPYGHHVWASEKPAVWKKRLRKDKSDKITLESKSWTKHDYVDSSTSRPMPSISASKDCPWDEMPPQRISSKLSENSTSSTLTEFLERAAEEEVLSLYTPPDDVKVDGVADISVTDITDADEEATLSTSYSENRQSPEVDSDCELPSWLDPEPDSGLLDELGEFAELLMYDLSYACTFEAERNRKARKT